MEDSSIIEGFVLRFSIIRANILNVARK